MNPVRRIYHNTTKLTAFSCGESWVLMVEYNLALEWRRGEVNLSREKHCYLLREHSCGLPRGNMSSLGLASKQLMLITPFVSEFGLEIQKFDRLENELVSV